MKVNAQMHAWSLLSNHLWEGTTLLGCPCSLEKQMPFGVGQREGCI